MMKNYPKISITFPVFNGGHEPIECLSSIAKLNYPKNKIEVIVVDNNSTDGSLQRIKNYEFRIKKTGLILRIIENKENVGFAKAINQGIRKSSGTYIFIGNDDIVFGKDSLKTMIEYMESHPHVAITGGKLFLKSKPKKIISCGFMMNPWNGKISRASHPNKEKEPDWLQGCAMLIPTKVLKKIGLLDEEFSMAYFEDFDLCMRAKEAGYSIRYLPSSIFWHGETITGNKNKTLKYYYWYKNKIRFTLKNMPLINILTILFFQFFLIMPYRSLIRRDGRFNPFIKGVMWNIMHFKQTVSIRFSTNLYSNKTAL